MKTLLFNLLLLLSLNSMAQYPSTRQNGALVREERYVTNSPGNGIANSVRIEYTKDSTEFMMEARNVGISRLSGNRNDSNPISFLWTDAFGWVRRSFLPNWIVTETDPLWTVASANYRTKSQNDLLYKAIGWVPDWTDVQNKPSLFNGDYNNLTNKPTLFSGNYNDLSNRPTLFNGDYNSLSNLPNLGLYYLASNPNGFISSINSLMVTNALGFTPYNATNPSGFISSINSGMISSALGYNPYNGTTNVLGFLTSSYTGFDIRYKPLAYVPAWTEVTGKPIFATVATSGSYNDLINKPTLPLADYTNTVTVSGSAGNAVFYLTSDKTINGTALYTNVNHVNPIINDSSVNYSYGWTLSGDKKTLTVNVKSAVGINVAVLGLTLLGSPANVANGISVNVLVKGS